MFGLRAHKHLQIPYSISPIGKEGNLLVHLQALRIEHLEQPPLWFLIITIHEPETLSFAIGRNALANNDLKAAPFSGLLLLSRMNIAAIDPDRKWTVRDRQVFPIPLTSFNKDAL